MQKNRVIISGLLQSQQMEMDTSGAPAARDLQAECADLLVLKGRLPLRVNRPAGCDQSAGLGQRRLQQGSSVGRIDEREVERGRRKPACHLDRVAVDHFDFAGAEAVAQRDQARHQRWIALDQRDPGGATRGQFEAERAGAGEQVDTTQRFQIVVKVRQPVEQRLSYPIRRRTQLRTICHRDRGAAVATADDPDPIRGVGQAARRGRGRLDVGQERYALWFKLRDLRSTTLPGAAAAG